MTESIFTYLTSIAMPFLAGLLVVVAATAVQRPVRADATAACRQRREQR